MEKEKVLIKHKDCKGWRGQVSLHFKEEAPRIIFSGRKKFVSKENFVEGLDLNFTTDELIIQNLKSDEIEVFIKPLRKPFSNVLIKNVEFDGLLIETHNKVDKLIVKNAKGTLTIKGAINDFEAKNCGHIFFAIPHDKLITSIKVQNVSTVNFVNEEMLGFNSFIFQNIEINNVYCVSFYSMELKTLRNGVEELGHIKITNCNRISIWGRPLQTLPTNCKIETKVVEYYPKDYLGDLIILARQIKEKKLKVKYVRINNEKKMSAHKFIKLVNEQIETGDIIKFIN